MLDKTAFICAGVTDFRFTWGADGTCAFVDDYPTDQRSLVEAVVASYDPNAGPTLAEVLADKSSAIQAAKCSARDAGFDVDGVHFDSDQSARTAYLELALEIVANPAYSTRWKASEGVWVIMNAALFAIVKAAGAAHMAAAFDWQATRDAELAAIKAAVAAGSMTDADGLVAVNAVSATYAS